MWAAGKLRWFLGSRIEVLSTTTCSPFPTSIYECDLRVLYIPPSWWSLGFWACVSACMVCVCARVSARVVYVFPEWLGVGEG